MSDDGSRQRLYPSNAHEAAYRLAAIAQNLRLEPMWCNRDNTRETRQALATRCDQAIDQISNVGGNHHLPIGPRDAEIADAP